MIKQKLIKLKRGKWEGKINETKLVPQNNKIDEPQQDSQKEDTDTNIGNEKGNSTTDTAAIRRRIKEYYE